MANKMIAVFTFDEPEDSETMAAIIGTLKEAFQGQSDVRSYLAKDRAARYVMEFFQTGMEVKSPLVEHAKRELSLIGDGDDDGFKESIVKAVQGFVSYGHSGGSAPIAIQMIYDLLQNKNLSPLTDDSREWNHVGPDVWQSNRNMTAFSEDGGKTYHLTSDEPRVIYNSEPKPKEDDRGS